SSTVFTPSDQSGGATTIEVWDFFNLAVASTITQVFGNFSDTTTSGHGAVQAVVTFRDGVSAGNGGSLSGTPPGSQTISVTSVATGRVVFGAPEYTYTGALAGA